MGNNSLTAQATESFFLPLSVITKSLNPFDALLVTKPGQLTLRIMTHVELGLFDCTLKTSLTAQIFNHAPITMGAKRVRISRHAFIQQPTNFFDQSICKMLLR